MRRHYVWLLAVLAALGVCAGCGGIVVGEAALTPTPFETPALTATPDPTPTPTPTNTPEPEGEPAESRIDKAGVIQALLSRGDAFEVTGEQEDFYIVTIDGMDLLIEKWLVRLDDAEAFQTWSGYAKGNTKVYQSAYQEGEPIATLAQNTRITVSDDLERALYIEWGEGLFGYVAPSFVSKSKYGSGGGGGGGGGADGGDIQLSLRKRAYTVVRLSNGQTPATGKGKALSDYTEAYGKLLSRGETIKVIDRDETYYHVLYDGRIGKVSLPLLRLTSEEAYAEWDGFARQSAPFYDNVHMLGNFEKLSLNTKLRVLEDLGSRYLVSKDGVLGFVLIDKVSATRLSGSSGGGGGGGEWTEPVL